MRILVLVILLVIIDLFNNCFFSQQNETDFKSGCGYSSYTHYPSNDNQYDRSVFLAVAFNVYDNNDCNSATPFGLDFYFDFAKAGEHDHNIYDNDLEVNSIDVTIGGETYVLFNYGNEIYSNEREKWADYTIYHNLPEGKNPATVTCRYKWNNNANVTTFNMDIVVESKEHYDEIEIIPITYNRINLKYNGYFKLFSNMPYELKHNNNILCSNFTNNNSCPLVQSGGNLLSNFNLVLGENHFEMKRLLYSRSRCSEEYQTLNDGYGQNFSVLNPSYTECSKTSHVYITVLDPCNYVPYPEVSEIIENEQPKCYFRVSNFDETLFEGLNITNISVDFGDGTVLNNLSEGDYLTHTYQTAGEKTIKQVFQFSDGNGFDRECERFVNFQAKDLEICCSNFAPEPGKTYWLSAWIKQDITPQPITYQGQIKIQYLEGADQISSVDFYPKGDIIDGWQRIVGKFTIPSATTDISLQLFNHFGMDVFYDDIRIHPYDASMKSFVYDPSSLKLMAELDDNNFATFYEYDNEGQLIRIKKETARGIMTIEEKRSSNPKVE